VGRQGADAIVVLSRDGAELASWPLAGSASPTLAVVDELARLYLAARRAGCTIRLRGLGTELWELLDLVGMRGLATGTGLPDSDGLRQVGRQAEGGEQLGVEEVVVPDDPVA
jgi:hypothetical protein